MVFRTLLITLLVPLMLPAQVRIERRTAGDTTIVRSIGVPAGSSIHKSEKVFSFGNLDRPAELVFGQITGVSIAPDGSLWIFDRQVPILRQYDSTGKYLRTVGRGGDGPGEYRNMMGFALFKDGSVAIMRPAAAGTAGQITLMDPRGAATVSWRVASENYSPRSRVSNYLLTPGGMLVDTAGLLYVETNIATPARGASPAGTVQGYTRASATGQIRDTIVPKPFGVGAQGITQSVGGGSSFRGIPYAPREFWHLSNRGHLIGARSDRYELHMLQAPRRILRIERDVPRVPVGSDERQARTEQMTASFRLRDPAWQWNGPPIPNVKPYFQNYFTDFDGRIWVSIHTPSERLPDAAQPASVRSGGTLPASVTRARFTEATLYEVFAPDGRFLARVQLPDYVYLPAIKGDYFWMSTVDANGAPQASKFRFVPPLPR